ncbi:copper chaperone PCu(A)C [Halomonas sp. Bachu 37]|uniref:copper chaperone PCu(A)C n=1 Tax=Halomonas kashgarensis TaxID=3084920 RepID=UPI003216260B
MRFPFVALPLTLCLLASGAALAHEVNHAGLHLAHPFATPTPPGAPNGAVYLEMTAETDGDTLLGADTPASETVELHLMAMEDDMMKMRRVEGIEVGAGETRAMRPGGGYHLMLINLTGPLREGDRFPLTLEFEQRGEIDVEVWVERAERSAGQDDAHH